MVLTASACGGMFVFGIVMALLGAVLPLVSQRIGFQLAEAGGLFLGMNAAMLVSVLALGPLTDRFGKKAPLAAGSALAGLALLAIAAAADYRALLGGVIALGAGGGALNGATNTLVADLHSDPRRKNAALNLLGVFFGFGALLLPLVIGALLEALGLVRILRLAAGFSLALAAVYLLLRFPPAKRAAGLPFAEVAHLARTPLVALFGFLLFFQSGNEFILGGYMTSYLTGELRLPLSQASYLLTAYWGAMMLVRVALSRLLLRAKGTTVVLASAAGAAVGIAVLAAARSGQAAGVGAVLTGVSFAAIFPTVLGQAGSRFEEHSGTVFGLLLAIALSGGMTLPWLVGQLGQAYGLRAALLVPVANALMIFALQAAISRMAPTAPAPR